MHDQPGGDRDVVGPVAQPVRRGARVGDGVAGAQHDALVGEVDRQLAAHDRPDLVPDVGHELVLAARDGVRRVGGLEEVDVVRDPGRQPPVHDAPLEGDGLDLHRAAHDVPVGHARQLDVGRAGRPAEHVDEGRVDGRHELEEPVDRGAQDAALDLRDRAGGDAEPAPDLAQRQAAVLAQLAQPRTELLGVEGRQEAACVRCGAHAVLSVGTCVKQEVHVAETCPGL
ncbi:hypothetical protein LJN57_014465 [Cellulomonas sp. zg-Y766]|nr:hypothetical protein [Cellulomonas wangsupingiae]MCM0640852.1 hypothetical protein [Cellulomonas wangsupingiae]